MDLDCGGLYTGGGQNSVPLPFAIPDRNKVLLKITSCDPSWIEMEAVTQDESDRLSCSEGRKCSDDGTPCVLDSDCTSGKCEDRCLFGAPLPVPNPGTPATSVCAVNVVAEDASGTGTCLGDSDVSAALRSVIYLNGDLFKSSTPPDLPGVQPCPLCIPVCSGGSRDGLPCRSDNDTTRCSAGSNDGEACDVAADCPGGSCDAASQELTDCINGGGTCPSTSECMGGPNDGLPCTPATSYPSVLGDAQDAFPTSHDCVSDPLQDITESIGGLPIDFAITTGTLTSEMPQQAIDRPQGRRNFCGYCRDVLGSGSLCFEGDEDAGCPAANPPATGNAVRCNSDADCQADADEYESCVQRNPGAFGESGATSINMEGKPAGCLAGGVTKPGTSVGTFCVPPTFDPTVDAAGDLPGPGGVSLQTDVQMR
jgi:hypothetical protein